MTAAERYWQNWDKGDAAARIDDFWCREEEGWRELLADDLRRAFADDDFPLELFEAGCGSGLIYGTLAARGLVTPASYGGGDISRNMLALARQRFPQVRFAEFDILGSGCADGQYANVISIHVLQHLPHYTDAVAELLRIARERLYLVSWFSGEAEDRVHFDESTRATLEQPFFNNCYSLPRFVGHLYARWPERIADLRIHHFGGPVYSLCLDLRPGVPALSARN